MAEKAIKEQEQQYLEHVLTEIKKAKTRAEERIKTAKNDIEDINQQTNDIHLNTPPTLE